MKNTADFFAWMRTKLGFSEDATVSEVQQALLDETTAATAHTEGVVDSPAVQSTTTNFESELATAQTEIARLTAELGAAQTALQTANTRIAELEAEPAAVHTNGPDEIDTAKPSASQDKELAEIGKGLRGWLLAAN